MKPKAQRGPVPVLGVGLSFSHSDLCSFLPRPCPQFLAFTCGLLRGTLSTLGIKSLVTASVAALPACELLREGGSCHC